MKVKRSPIVVTQSITAAAATERRLGKEAQRVIDTLLAPPAIKAEAGFSATLLVRPGELYDPMFMVSRADSVWINDQGGVVGDYASRILAVSPDGTISVLMGPDKLLPIMGFDVAPPGFGNYGGQIFALSQPAIGLRGALDNHVIQRIDLRSQNASVFCTLPASGTVGRSVAGMGADARFGPVGSGFANRFYSITALNDTIYQTQADGSCKPFVDLSAVGASGLTFTSDGSAMLVSSRGSPLLVSSAGEIQSSDKEPKGMIVRITPDGKVDPKPVVTGLMVPVGLAVAPMDFGSCAGQIFVTDMGDVEVPVPQTQALKRDGKVYRVTKAGELRLVASGFVNPVGVHFVGRHLWVTDINGELTVAMRELPDGFLVQIDIK